MQTSSNISEDRLCRVWIDLSRVRTNLLQGSAEGELVSEADVYEWLTVLGLQPDQASDAWFGAAKNLRHLGEDEILRIEHPA